MYKNVGKSIKDIVTTIVGIQMTLFILIGILLTVLVRGGVGFLLALVVTGGGCFFAWLSGLLLYAFGDIADNVRMLANVYAKAEPDTVVRSAETGKENKETVELFDLSTYDGKLTKFQTNMIKEYNAQFKNGVLSPEQYRKRIENILEDNK